MLKVGSNNIGKAYFGSNLIGKAYLGSNLVYDSGSGPSPQPTTIAYIRGGAGGSYIDTGITPDNTTKVIVWARNLNPSANGYGYLFGTRVAWQDSMFGLSALDQQYIGNMRVVYGSYNADVTNAWANLSSYHKYELSGNGLYVDDVLVCSCTANTFSSNYNIYLFGLNNAGTIPSNGSPMDICAAKIYKNNVLVRDFTPVNSPSVGLYDDVSKTVFTNAGSGNFTYGTFNPEAYTPLEYVSCSAVQYFDSGVYGTYDLSFVCTFMPTNTTPKWNTVLGERVSSPANSCDIALGTASSGQDNMRLYWRFGDNTTSSTVYDNVSNKLTNKKITAVKSNATLTVYYNNAQIGTASKAGVSSSFTTTYPLAVGSLRTGESTYQGTGLDGNIYYVLLGGNKNFVPAKVNNVAGMYDTYNDVFYPSISGTDFVAGPNL